MRNGLRRGGDTRRAFDDLRDRGVNYVLGAGQPTREGGWHLDDYRTVLAYETPGPPVPGGAFEMACRLVRDYEFSQPGIVHAAFRPDAELLGRDMLLEARFHGLRFYLGVRVTQLVDDADGDRQVWGWGYSTLEGHLEQGRLTYEVVKHLADGSVEFVLSGYSRAAPIPNPVIRLGFTMFGRWTQLRFYRACGQRLRGLVQAGLGGGPLPSPEPVPGHPALVTAPSRV